MHQLVHGAAPRRNLTRGPSMLGSGYAYGAVVRRRSSGLPVVARQDLALGDLRGGGVEDREVEGCSYLLMA